MAHFLKKKQLQLDYPLLEKLPPWDSDAHGLFLQTTGGLHHAVFQLKHEVFLSFLA